MKRVALGVVCVIGVLGMLVLVLGVRRWRVPFVAELVARRGTVTSARGASPSRFEPVELGSVFDIGDTVHTATDSSATLRFDDGSVLYVRPRSTVRFLETRPGVRRPRIDVVSGEAVLTVETARELDTVGGIAHLSAGTRVVLRAHDGALDLVVTFGTARLDLGSRTERLGPNETFRLGGGSGERAHATEVPAATETAIAHSEASVDRAAAIVGTEAAILDARANRVDVAIEAGSNPTVRDLHPPTALGIATPRSCGEGAVVEQLAAGTTTRVSARAVGQGTIPVAFAEGTTRYQVRCLASGAPGRVVAHGRVRILRTSGQAPLPRTAPTARIDADGRTYDVLFQNRLPNLTILWPNGPSGNGELVVETGRGPKRYRSQGPERALPAGTLTEGSHRLHFESGRRRSRDAIVNVRFDPGAPSAALESPSDGSFAPLDRVHVTGMALAGWSVTAQGQPIRVGSARRFAGDVVVPANGVLVVRLAKAGQGEQLYVRRAREAGR